MKKIFFSKEIKKENGQSVVEFALVIPVLIFFMLGILEFGWLFNANIILTSAAREGVRAAVVSEDNRSTKAFAAATETVQGTSGITLVNNSTNYKYYEVVDTEENTNNAVVEIIGSVEPLIGIFQSDPYRIEARAVMRIE